MSQLVDTMVNVGTYRLHFVITKGTGVPILFESGAGNDGSVWTSLIKPLHDSLGATLITYDRQGFGKSDIDTTDINIVSEIKGLEIALRKLGFRDKYFLVAHSLGGSYAMVFSQRNKNKVVGGVFIDIVSPCFMTDRKALEIQRLFKDSVAAIKRESIGLYYIGKNYLNTTRVMREAALSLQMPLTILCADKPPFGGDEAIRWKDCMKVFAEQQHNRRYLLVKNADHHIFIDEPGIVINEIISRYKN